MNRSRFFSVPARFSGSVVCRAGLSGIVWARRAKRDGERTPPSCLFVPMPSQAQAARVARAAGRAQLKASVKPAQSCACYRSGPLAASAPAFAVKVQLAPGQKPPQALASLVSSYRAGL